MRKYRQLVLVLITLASLCTLLMYRHEYLKLRYVLEVLNFFGNPQANINDCLVLNETYTTDNKNKLLFVNPSPSWLKLGSHFVYSAFWEFESGKHHVRTLAIGPPSAFTDIECHIWFDQGELLFSEMGKFGYSVKNIQRDSSYKDSKLKIYELYCELIENSVVGRPHGVIFVQKKPKINLKTFVPIYNTLTEHNVRNHSAMCVKADASGVSKSTIVEFISYHLIIGITDFIIYDTGLHHNILTTLQTLPGVSGFSRTTVALNWNFPFEDADLQDAIMEMDCMGRTSGKVELVMLLDWDEYIVPKSTHNIYKMVHTIEPTMTTEFEVATVICCTDIKDDKSSDKSWPVSLRKTQCMPLMKKIKMLYNPKKGDVRKQQFPPDVGEIFVYRFCKGLKKTVTKYDPVMAQFLGDLMTSKLLRLRKSGIFLNSS
ncbi:uncharacterized protein LOC142321369 [Lycorma delicatula]|uniref:uncharacterized protein LOC142321369 n=1 Tax=Lycorma delicatula TaxID=130591 RepID=UPI003F5105BC